MANRAVITGVSGQDGYYLAKLLLSKGYYVVGVRRRRANPTLSDRRIERMASAISNFVLTDGDVTDLSSMSTVVKTFKPEEFYHLAAQSHVGKSWGMASSTLEVTGVGTLNCLQALYSCQSARNCRFYFAGSSEQFGNTGSLLNEQSAMQPESPYAAAKVLGYNLSHVYRRSYDMFASCGILFNHESPIRGEEFVTRKITSHLARIHHGLQSKIHLGNMYAKRDWGFAGDYVEAMWLMLQADEPDDFVVATNQSWSVREFFDTACEYYGLDPEAVLEVDATYMRPKDINVLLGDPTHAKDRLGWEPKVDFRQLVHGMCEYDMVAQNPDASIAAKAEDLL